MATHIKCLTFNYLTQLRFLYGEIGKSITTNTHLYKAVSKVPHDDLGCLLRMLSKKLILKQNKQKLLLPVHKLEMSH